MIEWRQQTLREKAWARRMDPACIRCRTLVLARNVIASVRLTGADGRIHRITIVSAAFATAPDVRR